MAAWVLALLCIRLASPNVGLESSSMSTISWGRLVIFHPCNKWAGVSGSGSPISDDTNVREQSFRIALISTTIVFKVWRDTWCLPYTGSYMLLKQSWPLDMCCISLFCGIFPLYTTWNNSGINLGGCSSVNSADLIHASIMTLLNYSYTARLQDQCSLLNDIRCKAA